MQIVVHENGENHVFDSGEDDKQDVLLREIDRIRWELNHWREYVKSLSGEAPNSPLSASFLPGMPPAATRLAANSLMASPVHIAEDARRFRTLINALVEHNEIDFNGGKISLQTTLSRVPEVVKNLDGVLTEFIARRRQQMEERMNRRPDTAAESEKVNGANRPGGGPNRKL